MVDSRKTEHTKTYCQCGANLALPRSAIGKKVRCPRCSEVFVATEDVKPHETIMLDEDSTQDPAESLLDDLASLEQSAPTIEQAASNRSVTCPSCLASMPADARICVACGYDNETGKTLKTKKKVGNSLLKKAAKKGGRLMIGSTCSAIGALIGAGIWFGIAIGTGYEIGWIAWGVGLLAGFGMLLGYQDTTPRAGAIAAMIAAIGVLFAKVLVFSSIVYAITTGDTNDLDLQRGFVAMNLTNEELDNHELWSEEQREEAWESVSDEVEKRVLKMSKDEVHRRVQEFKDEEARLNAWQSDTGRQRTRIAQHRATQRADKQGLSPNDNQRDELNKQEFKRTESLQQDELNIAIAELTVWEKSGQWEEESAVRSRLIYHYASESIDEYRKAEMENSDDYWTPDEQQWKHYYEEAKQKAETLSHEDRVVALRNAESSSELDYARERLVGHVIERRAAELGLSYADDMRTELRKEEQQRTNAMSEDEVKSAIAVLDLWEAGDKWQDEAWVRDHLIYLFVDTSIAENQSNDDEYRAITGDEWSRLYNEAKRKVDDIAPNLRKAKVDELQQQSLQQQEQLSAQYTQEELAESAGSIVTFFFSNMFSPMDILFFILAIGSAYKLASGSSDNG